jgi:excisionase family DNA binding protein
MGTTGSAMQLDANQQELLGLVCTRRKAQNLFTIEELAQFMNISARTIRRMHAAGLGPPRFRRSRRICYSVESVIEWLDKLPPYEATPLGSPVVDMK